MRGSYIAAAVVMLCSLAGRAHAGPARCAPGYQDASCRGVLTNAPQTPPACPTSPGYATTKPAQWAGSRYTAPECSYTPPPSCPSGYEPTQNPSWNGSSWVGLTCQQITPQPPKPLEGKTVYIAVNTKTGLDSPYITLRGSGTSIVATYTNGQTCTFGPGQTCQFNKLSACYAGEGAEGFVQRVYDLMNAPYGDQWAESGCEAAFVRLEGDGQTITAGYGRLPSSFEQTRQGAWMGAARGFVMDVNASNGSSWRIPGYQQYVY